MDPRGNPATLFWCVRNEGSAAHLRELAALADELPDFTLMLHASEGSGRAPADTILKATGLDPSNLSVAFCGPEPMRKALSKGFSARGVPVRKVRYEEFEIRSGVGLKALASHLMERMTRPHPAPSDGTGRSRSGVLSSSGAHGTGRVTQANQSPVNPARFTS